jgi:hypothetical protein
LAQAKGLPSLIYHEPMLEVRFMRGVAGTARIFTIREICAASGRRILNAPFIEQGKEAENGQEFCSRACRDGETLTGIGSVLAAGRARLMIREQKQARVRRQEYHRELMRIRRSPLLARNCLDRIENTTI